jgi:hypothetical protein
VKTSGGTRVLYFFDDGCVVVCSEAALAIVRGALRIVEDQ